MSARASQKRRFGSIPPGWRQRLGVVLPVLSLLGGGLLAPRQSYAKSGFFQTIGISIVVGTVLGVSTLPFYDQPGKHISNLALGAAAGAVAGIGIFVHEIATRDESEEGYAAERREGVSPRRRPPAIASIVLETRDWVFRHSALRSPAVLLPLVSLNW